MNTTTLTDRLVPHTLLTNTLVPQTLLSTAGVRIALTSALTGPPGSPGIPGGAGITALAGEAMGGHRAVVLDAFGQAFYADCSTPSHFGRLAGITTGAAVLGDSVYVIQAGVVIEPSWAWTPDAPIFLGVTGLLTQTAPVAGFLQVVGMALSATAIFVNPREPLATL